MEDAARPLRDPCSLTLLVPVGCSPSPSGGCFTASHDQGPYNESSNLSVATTARWTTSASSSVLMDTSRRPSGIQQLHRAVAHRLLLLVLLLLLCSSFPAASSSAGFLSIDCGGAANFTDELGLLWTSDAAFIATGTPTAVNTDEKRTQYTTLRAFPVDDAKHCYVLPVATRTRYLVRATFLYAGFDGDDAFPVFDLYLGATRWSPIVIDDGASIITREVLVLAQSPSISVCLSNATTGRPFISTLELRPLNGSLYQTDAETRAFLTLAARINFGSPTAAPVRYPDDPYDRIWESDMARRPNYLVDAALGTTNVSTNEPVFVAKGERPPEKVMQTAVVGTLGELTYRLNLNGFPGAGWAFCYFAEIEESVVPHTRRFKAFIPGLSDVSEFTVDVAENAPGRFRLYQAGYPEVILPFVFSFAFRKTNESSRGPILNAVEIYRYVEIDPGSPDASPFPHGNVDSGRGRHRHKLIIIISAVLGACLVGVSWYALIHKATKKNSAAEDDPTKAAGKSPSCEIATETFRLCDLEAATNNFANRIGSGGFGIIYYGELPDGTQIAVKVPKNDSCRGKKQIINEVSLLSRIHHRNLVAFLGYCHEDGRNILVYEFMMNGTLKQHLHGGDNNITWIQRLQIAEDSAKGIEYLHSGCTPSIVHRDIKTSNILLDKHMRAKVSDFGLSKLVAEESDGASTSVHGTLGYLDPQYYISHLLTEKSDVYSFGIILLELISGRPPISVDMTFGDQFCNIGAWAKFYYESGDIDAVMDPAIAGEYRDVHSVWKVAETAVRCIDADARRRPCMAEVLKEVQEAIALERPPRDEAVGRSHDTIIDNLVREDDESASFSETLRQPKLR